MTEQPDKWNKKNDLKPNKIEKLSKEDYWVVVPREPATLGHLLVVSWKGEEENSDISDRGLFQNPEHMNGMMYLIHKLTVAMKEKLTFQERKCEKVYVATLCETEKFPFHFHLIPRFEGDREGFAYLFEKELEEARWLFDCQEECKSSCEKNFEKKCYKKYEKLVQSSGRILDAGCLLMKHREKLCSNSWVLSNNEREQLIKKTKQEIEKIS